ncbi:MAG: acylphosphatase [Actinomycetota bacterium]|nr:acylphosphatase [Actinomycetota bacterium]
MVSPERVRRRLLVEGRVQGVFYRDTCRTQAQQAGLAGWARNRADGAVEVVIEGEAHAVERLVAWCRSGPPQAIVTAVKVSAEEPEGISGFTVR